MHTRQRVVPVTVRASTLKGPDAGLYYVEALPSYYLDAGEPPGVAAGLLQLAGELSLGPHPNQARRDPLRADPARRQGIAGAGLGLTIAREIILKAGGDIRIANGAERGLVQTIRLPLASA